MVLRFGLQKGSHQVGDFNYFAYGEPYFFFEFWKIYKIGSF